MHGNKDSGGRVPQNAPQGNIKVADTNMASWPKAITARWSTTTQGAALSSSTFNSESSVTFWHHGSEDFQIASQIPSPTGSTAYYG